MSVLNSITTIYHLILQLGLYLQMLQNERHREINSLEYNCIYSSTCAKLNPSEWCFLCLRLVFGLKLKHEGGIYRIFIYAPSYSLQHHPLEKINALSILFYFDRNLFTEVKALKKSLPSPK